MRYTYEIVVHADDGRTKVVAAGVMDQEAYEAFLKIATVKLDVDDWNAIHAPGGDA